MPTLEDVRSAILNDLTVPIWPHAGLALKASRNAVYEAAKAGEIPTIRIGRCIRVPTAPLRKMLGMEAGAAAAPAGKAA